MKEDDSTFGVLYMPFISRLCLLISATGGLWVLQKKWLDLVYTIDVRGLSPFILPSELRILLPSGSAINSSLPYITIISIIICFFCGLLAGSLSWRTPAAACVYQIQAQIGILGSCGFWLTSFQRLGPSYQMMQQSGAEDRFAFSVLFLWGCWLVGEVILYYRRREARGQ